MKFLIIIGAIVMATPFSSQQETSNDTFSGELGFRQGGTAPRKFFCSPVGTAAATMKICAEKTTRTWSEANKYCESLGLKLPVIKNAQDFDALAKASSTELMNGFNYWTAGRDSLEVTQFVWDDPEGPLDASLKDKFKNYYNYEAQSCLFFRKQSKSILGFAPCSAKCFTLCQA